VGGKGGSGGYALSDDFLGAGRGGGVLPLVFNGR
jgi:hypothetical protein